MLLALLMGGIEFGRFAYLSILVGNAARAGAAYGSVGLVQSVDTTGMQAAADNDFKNNGQSTSNLTVSSSTTCGCDSDGAMTSEGCTTESDPTAGSCTSDQWQVMVSVTASGTFKSMFHYPMIPTSITVSRTVTLRVNQYGG
jgi:Flp pilus assembly protein TadG